jgi:hypothetical protein
MEHWMAGLLFNNEFDRIWKEMIVDQYRPAIGVE